MWNIMSSNRILDLRWKQQAQKKHRRALKNVKSSTNTSCPRKYSFLDTKPKRKQIQLERRMEIESHNSMLVGRMINTTSQIKRDPIYFKDSLNSVFCKKVEKQIDDNNQQLVKRLQHADSLYSQKKMAKNRRMYDKVKTNMAHSRMDPFYDLNSGRQFSQNLNLRAKTRPFSAKR